MESNTRRLNIRTFGQFSVSAGGVELAQEWPGETSRRLFLLLLSPLEPSVSWERVCRDLWGVPATYTSRRRAMALAQHLQRHICNAWGRSDILHAAEDGISLNMEAVRIDAYKFRTMVLSGLEMLVSGCSRFAAYSMLRQAVARYEAPFLPGVPDRIVASAREELEALYWIACGHALPMSRFSGRTLKAA